MENKFKKFTISEFKECFPDDDSYYEYLSELKWGNGFVCTLCDHSKYYKSRCKYNRQCISCRHGFLPTSQILFHKKFPILKVFYIVYYVSSSKKDICSTELSRKLEQHQKIGGVFKWKVTKVIGSKGRYKTEGKAEVDETVVGRQKEGVKGRKNNKKKLVVFAIEKKGKGGSRMYGKVIGHSSSKELGAISKNSTEFYRAIMNFKDWLRGMHHLVHHLQSYIDEYCYRFNRSYMNENPPANYLQRAYLLNT